MQDYPPFANRVRDERRPHGYEPHEIQDTGATLWIAVVVVVAALAVVLAFSQDKLKNGGAPFMIVPSGQVTVPATAGN